MGRRPKESVEKIVDKDQESEFPRNLPSPPIDISKLVSSVKSRYEKNNPGAASLVNLGSDLALSNNPSDYIYTQDIRKYWGPLTGLIGLPFGRIVQISGAPDSGKSTLALLFMAAAQREGTVVVLWDAENKFSEQRFRKHMGGCPEYIPSTTSKLIIEGARQVTQMVNAAKEQNPDCKILIVWDSVGATLNSAEDDSEDDDYSKQPGVTAREVTWAIKKFNRLIAKNRNKETGEETVSVLCINQTYANIGSVGQKEKGGSELTYLSSMILQLTRKSDLIRQKAGQKMKYGITTRAKVKKNHLFDGEECVAELDLVVSADGIKLANEIKNMPDILGWSEED